MNSVIQSRRQINTGGLNNLHFWIIAFLIIVLTYVYYWDMLVPAQRWGWFWHIIIIEFKYNINGILFAIPLVYATCIFWWRGALITWLLVMAIIFPRILYFSSSPLLVVLNILYLLIPLLIVFYIAMERNWRAKERQTMAEREDERQDYMSRIFQAQENERQHLSRELHDSAIQTLLVIASRAQNLGENENMKCSRESKEQTEWIKDTVLSVSQELRGLTMDLRPRVLDNLGLIPALRWLVDDLEQDGLSTHLTVNGTPRVLSTEIDINLFRIVQEALSNVRRHAKATEVSVTLEFATHGVRLEVCDNGTGFPVPDTDSELLAMDKLGLVGMQQRTRFIKGDLNLDSSPGKGTRITVSFDA